MKFKACEVGKSVMMSLCELLFSPKEEKNNKGATLEKEYEAAQRVGAGRRAKRGAEGREANARAASASAHATLAGFGFDVVEETEKPNLHGFDVLEEAAEVVRAPCLPAVSARYRWSFAAGAQAGELS